MKMHRKKEKIKDLCQVDKNYWKKLPIFGFFLSSERRKQSRTIELPHVWRLSNRIFVMNDFFYVKVGQRDLTLERDAGSGPQPAP